LFHGLENALTIKPIVNTIDAKKDSKPMNTIQNLINNAIDTSIRNGIEKYGKGVNGAEMWSRALALNTIGMFLLITSFSALIK
jgi:NAD(P)-dependent dehydrogenase (short-subunit alcohol dehydrogenase family)